MRKPVAKDEWLYRRGFASPVKKYMNPDGTATSSVFALREKDEGELSVDVKSMTAAEESVKDPDKFMLFEITNVDIITLDLLTEHDPLPNDKSSEINAAHAVILGMEMEDEIKPGLLARKSRRVYI